MYRDLILNNPIFHLSSIPARMPGGQYFKNQHSLFDIRNSRNILTA